MIALCKACLIDNPHYRHVLRHSPSLVADSDCSECPTRDFLRVRCVERRLHEEHFTVGTRFACGSFCQKKCSAALYNSARVTLEVFRLSSFSPTTCRAPHSCCCRLELHFFPLYQLRRVLPSPFICVIFTLKDICFNHNIMQSIPLRVMTDSEQDVTILCRNSVTVTTTEEMALLKKKISQQSNGTVKIRTNEPMNRRRMRHLESVVAEIARGKCSVVVQPPQHATARPFLLRAPSFVLSK